MQGVTPSHSFSNPFASDSGAGRPSSNGSTGSTSSNGSAGSTSHGFRPISNSSPDGSFIHRNSPPPGSTTHRPSSGSSVHSVNPATGTPGLRPSSASQPDLNSMDLPALSRLGNEQLDAAKKAYQNYGEINVAQRAQQALQSFINACNNNGNDRDKMITALKAITLPSGSPTDLSVTIKFPGDPSVSLIPPDDKQLKNATTKVITQWYEMAFQAMENWSQQNIKSANALEAAQQQLNDAVAALKATRDAIDRKTKEMTNMAGQSQLEMEYQKFVDQGITIHFDSNIESISAAGTPHPAASSAPANSGNPSPDVTQTNPGTAV